MKNFCRLTLLLALTSAGQVLAQDTGVREVTLFSPIKHGPYVEKARLNFESASFVPDGRRWDLLYGALYAGEDHDWLQVSTARETRSAVRDLGALGWTDSFKVPVVEPFPELKEGAQRTVSIDTSGADGKPGKSGGAAGGVESITWGSQPSSMTQTPPPVEIPWLARTRPAPQPATPRRPRQDGVPKIDPVFVKAVVGHIYVIHVVDAGADYYALFRVESLVPGDRCTISWKLIPPPESRGGRQEK